MGIFETLAGITEKDLELRVSKQLAETIWYMENMGIPAHMRDTIISCILDIEPEYRAFTRSAENSKRDQNPDNEKAEAAVNHLLSVIRIALGMIQLNYVNAREKKLKSLKFYEFLSNPVILMTLCIGGMSHDYVEDWVDKALKEDEDPSGAGKYGESKLRKIILKGIQFSDKEFGVPGAQIVEDLISFSRLLNTYNFTSENNEVVERDFGKYCVAIIEKGILPTLLKLSDVIANKQSRPEKRHETVYVESKDISYINFLYEVVIDQKLFTCAPIRFVVRMIDEYPEWLNNANAVALFKTWISNFNPAEKYFWSNKRNEIFSLQTAQQVEDVLMA